MENKIINTGNYLLIVDESEIKEGDWIYCDKYSLDSYKYDFIKHIPLPIVTRCFKKNGYDIWFNYDDKKYEAEGGFNSTVFKIIAHLPLNNSPILEGVDLLPQIEDEVEKLAIKKYPVNMGEEWTEEGLAYPLDFNYGFRQGFIDGYNKAKEKYKYTEEDLRKAIDMATNGKKKVKDEKGIEFLFGLHEDEIIQSLQQPKMPVMFKCEVVDFEVDMGLGQECIEYSQYPKTTTNSQGLTQWVGEYIY